MQIFHAYSLILRKRSRILRENHFIKICVNHPVGQHVLHPFPHQPHYGLLSPGQHPAKLWRCIQFLFRPFTICFYQRRFIQIFPYIISPILGIILFLISYLFVPLILPAPVQMHCSPALWLLSVAASYISEHHVYSLLPLLWLFAPEKQKVFLYSRKRR